MILKVFPPYGPRVLDFFKQAGVKVERAHQTMSLLHVPDESKIEELRGENFRRYKRITMPNGKVFELDYFRKETQNRLAVVIPKRDASDGSV